MNILEKDNNEFTLDFSPPMNTKVKSKKVKNTKSTKSTKDNQTIDWVEDLTGEKYKKVKRGENGY